MPIKKKITVPKTDLAAYAQTYQTDLRTLRFTSHKRNRYIYPNLLTSHQSKTHIIEPHPRPSKRHNSVHLPARQYTTPCRPVNREPHARHLPGSHRCQPAAPAAGCPVLPRSARFRPVLPGSARFCPVLTRLPAAPVAGCPVLPSRVCRHSQIIANL